MSIRTRLRHALDHPGPRRVGLWLVALVLCAVPGLGALLAFAWVVTLWVMTRSPVATLGLRRPPSWARLLLLALLAAVLIQSLEHFVTEPLGQALTGQAPDLSMIVGDIEGNAGQLAVLLALSWLSGALIEETVFHGFLIGFGAVVFGERARWPLAIVSSVIFGWGHLYQGPAGMLSAACIGFALAALYIASGRNLLLTMLVHGLVDTITVVALYLGWIKLA